MKTISEDLHAEILTPYVDEMKEQREKLALSMSRIARDSGYSQKYVSLLESHERVPSLDAMIALSSAVGFERDFILDLVNELMDEYEWGKKL
jgi:transcriptional regulator with XRE-family HTH domain